MRRPWHAGFRGPRLIAGALLAVVAAASAAWSAGPPLPWQVTVTQFDKAGTLAAAPQVVSCPQSGCQQIITLDVLGKPHRFLLSVTPAARGAYVGLQAQDQDVGNVVEFEKGFVGPVFMATHQGLPTSTTLRFTLTGPAAISDPQRQDQLMGSAGSSLVFHRKMDPDLALRVELVPPEAKPGG